MANKAHWRPWVRAIHRDIGYVAVGHDKVGTEIQVDCRGKAIAAVVVPTPFYKRPS